MQFVIRFCNSIAEFGFNTLYKSNKEWENQSIIEDNENHFHVVHYIKPPDNKKSFMLGVKMLTLLAEKFERANLKELRFTFSFQTPELGQKFADANNIEDNEHFISDRLSFHTIRQSEEIINIIDFDNSFFGILIIEI